METLLLALLDLAKGAGGFAIVIVLLLWLLIKSDKERRELLTQLIELSHASNSAAQAWAELLQKSGRK